MGQTGHYYRGLTNSITVRHFMLSVIILTLPEYPRQNQQLHSHSLHCL